MILEERVGGMERITRRIGSSVVFPNELLGVSLAPDNAYMYKLLTRLAAYEDTGLEPEEIMGLCSMDHRAKMAELLRMEENKPLPPDDLPKIDGTPVWVTKMDGSGGVWMLVDEEYELCRGAHGEMAVLENCGKTWLAYRRRPEEEIT